MKVFRTALQSIRANRLRSTLAGFGIAWGIFLLVIFLGIGNGFRDGVMMMFSSFAQKSLFVYGGQTSSESSELGENTQVYFDESTIEGIRRRYSCVMSISPEMMAQAVNLSCGRETMVSAVKGVSADYFKIKILEVKDGRRISRLDNACGRYVAVIGEGIRKTLFGKQDGLGRMIDIGGSLFKVIGVLSSDDIFSVQERNSVYIPSEAFYSSFNSEGKLSSLCLSLSQDMNTSEIEKDLKGWLAWKYGFDPHDESALYIANIETQTSAFESLFRGLEVLIWIVGVCLLLSGIVGVCNVMLIIVKERTNEIGIRKAVGATSRSIISMIMAESVTITFIAGVIGIVLGTLVVLLSDSVILPLLNTEIMDRISINVPVVIAAFVILCLSGLAAGLFPALKASQITPVDAIRYDSR